MLLVLWFVAVAYCAGERLLRLLEVFAVRLYQSRALFAAAGCGAVVWPQLFGTIPSALAVAGAALPLTFAVLNSPSFEFYGAWACYGWPLIKTHPIRHLTGQESKGGCLNRQHPGFRSV